MPIREENAFAFSADDLLERITPETRLIILNSPANPTGGVTPAAEIDKLVQGLERWPDVAIMSDEIYDQMTYDGARPQDVPRLRGAQRSRYPAQRLEQDIRHDRLASRL